MNEIEEIWDRGKEQTGQDSSMESSAILRSISEGSKGIAAGLLKPLRFGIVIAVLAFIMFIYNCFFYSANLPVMIAILLLLVVSAAIIVFLLSQIKVVRGMHQMDMDLRALLIFKIKYLNTRYNWAVHCISLSVVLATFTINLSMENNDGIIELHKILILSAFYFFAYLLGFRLLKLSLSVIDKQLKNALYNLEEQSLRSLDGELKKHRRISRIILSILIIFSLLGILVLILH